MSKTTLLTALCLLQLKSNQGCLLSKCTLTWHFHFLALLECFLSALRVLGPDPGPFPRVKFLCCFFVESLSHFWLFATPWTAVPQASLSFTISQSSVRVMSTELVMPSKHLILCRPLLLLPSIFPSFRLFSNKSSLCIRWPKFWRFSFSISPSNDYSRSISFGWTGLICLQSKGLSRVFSNTTVGRHQFFSALSSLWFNSHNRTWLLMSMKCLTWM